MYMILTQSIEDFPGKTDIPRARETANRHICCWFSLDLRFWDCQASTVVGVHALKSVSPLIPVCSHSLFCRLFQSSLLFLFCMHVLHGICMHVCMHGVMCTCVNVCRSQRSVSNVFLDCSSLFLRVALSLTLKYTNSARLPVQQLLVFSCLCLPSVAHWVHTATFSFLHGAGDQKQGLNKHSKHITNQTVSLAFLPSLWTLTNPSTVFTSYTQAVHTSCTIPSGVENVTNPPA